MTKQEKIKIRVFKTGSDVYRVRLTIPGERPKEIDVNGTLMEVEAAIIDSGIESLDADKMGDLYKALGVDKFFEGVEKAKDTTGIAHIIAEPGSKSKVSWCETKLGDEFFFNSIDHAIYSIRTTDEVLPCRECVTVVEKYISDYMDGKINES